MTDQAERLRIELAKALVRLGAAEDEAVLFQWHPCVDTPACRAAADPQAPCACSGIPYLSDAAWAEIAPIVRRVHSEPQAVTVHPSPVGDLAPASPPDTRRTL